MTELAQIRGVIFDWGGVITTPIAETVLAWLASERISRESYTAAMRPWVRQAYGGEQAESPIHALERGEMSDAVFEQTLAAALVDLDGGQVPSAGLLKRMFAGSRLQPDMVALIGELRERGLRTGLLSNSWGSRVSYPYDLLDELFDDSVISRDVGMRKPEERIFHLAAQRLGVSPAEAIFVDDVEGNIVAAKALGFGVVHHSDPASTRALLEELLGRTAAA